MVRSKLLAAAVVALLSFAASPTVCAQEKSPFVGVWKLDTTSPTVGSPRLAATLTITLAGNGVQVDVRETAEGQPEQTWSFQSGGDSQEMPVTGLSYVDSVTTRSNGERSSTSVFKKAGTVVSESTAEVSADGKTLTMTSKRVGPSGEPVSSASVYRRQSS